MSFELKMEKLYSFFSIKHVSVRSNAEAIAFYQSGRLENQLTNDQLDKLIKTQQRLVNWQFPLARKIYHLKMQSFPFTVSTQTIDYFGGILSYLIIAIPIFVLDSYEDVPPTELAGIISKVDTLNSKIYAFSFRTLSSTCT